MKPSGVRPVAPGMGLPSRSRGMPSASTGMPNSVIVEPGGPMHPELMRPQGTGGSPDALRGTPSAPTMSKGERDSGAGSSMPLGPKVMVSLSAFVMKPACVFVWCRYIRLLAANDGSGFRVLLMNTVFLCMIELSGGFHSDDGSVCVCSMSFLLSTIPGLG